MKFTVPLCVALARAFGTVTCFTASRGGNRILDRCNENTVWFTPYGSVAPFQALENNENSEEEEEWSDFDDLGFSGSGIGEKENDRIAAPSDAIRSGENQKGQDSQPNFLKLMQERRGSIDWTAIQTRQFSLGQDLVLSDYVGNMGFDAVTDWEYYYPSQDRGDIERQVVQPNPFDSSKPKRTRTSSGSVIRIFRGEFVGQLGGIISAQGLDRRVLVKEFSGSLALSLASAELESVGLLQSDLVAKTEESAKRGEWIQAASSRSSELRQDNSNVVQLTKAFGSASLLGIFGEVNLAELDGNMSPNDFYRALGVPPPKPDAVWVVYEYAGLSTVDAYAAPAQIRRENLPTKKGFFGNRIDPPKLPDWPKRANYVVNGIMKQSILAIASIHESGIVHRSIGRTSILISTKSMDKREAVSPFNTMTSGLQIKLADFGFSGPYERSTSDEEFCTRARSFGLQFQKNENTIASANFAIAEDMHALGFVFLGLLLSSLAELPNAQYQMPATDEDTLQRLLGEIFDKDFDLFREYVEAEDIWSNLVALLDENDKSGWKVLEILVMAREKAASLQDESQMLTLRGLLSNPFFSQ